MIRLLAIYVYFGLWWLALMCWAIGAHLADRQTANELDPTDQWVRDLDERAQLALAEQAAASQEYEHYRRLGQLGYVSGLPGRR